MRAGLGVSGSISPRLRAISARSTGSIMVTSLALRAVLGGKSAPTCADARRRAAPGERPMDGGRPAAVVRGEHHPVRKTGEAGRPEVPGREGATFHPLDAPYPRAARGAVASSALLITPRRLRRPSAPAYDAGMR